MKMCKRYYFASWASLALTVFACERSDTLAARAMPTVTVAPQTKPSAIDVGEEAGVEREDDVCSNASLEGFYGFVRTGGTSDGPLAAIGLVTYDGEGTWVATATISRHGAYTFDAPSSGTYVVDPDCTGKVLSEGQEIGLLDLVDGGNAVLVLSEVPGDAVTELQKKVGLHSCSNASLAGEFGFVRSGTTSAGPLAALGFDTFDGAGNVVARQVTSRNGVFTSSGTFPGTYQFGTDCQGKFFLANGQEISRFVIVDRGNEIFQISETTGNAVTGDQRKVSRSRGW